MDITVAIDSDFDPDLSQQMTGLGRQLSVLDETGGFGLRSQAVPFFAGEEDGHLARAIRREVETVWTKI